MAKTKRHEDKSKDMGSKTSVKDHLKKGMEKKGKEIKGSYK